CLKMTTESLIQTENHSTPSLPGATQERGPLPAFQWEKWYAAAGGRTIDISEVNTYLHQIREEQNPRFTGPVASTRREVASPEEADAHLKEKASEFGADLVGICEIEPSDVYRGRTITEKYAIAVGQRMRWRAF